MYRFDNVGLSLPVRAQKDCDSLIEQEISGVVVAKVRDAQLLNAHSVELAHQRFGLQQVAEAIATRSLFGRLAGQQDGARLQ